MMEDLSVDRLLDYLASEPEGAILFTGGGILPEQVLMLPQLKFLHVHPGFLPAIRGADCALWSTTVRTTYFGNVYLHGSRDRYR